MSEGSRQSKAVRLGQPQTSPICKRIQERPVTGDLGPMPELITHVTPSFTGDGEWRPAAIRCLLCAVHDSCHPHHSPGRVAEVNHL